MTILPLRSRRLAQSQGARVQDLVRVFAHYNMTCVLLSYIGHHSGEDMRIALRRPDGAWHFTDSRTPFTPSGVGDIDVIPSPMSSSTSLMSFNSRLPLNHKKSQEAKSQKRDYHKGYDPDLDFELSPTALPPPAYCQDREPCRDHFDEGRFP